MATSTIDLRSLIAQQAPAYGVPAAIALAVAQKESSISQWNPDGSLVTGSSGEVGVFQIMARTATGMGVNPADLGDVDTNISTGLSLLSQLYQRYGNWNAALSAYNSGSPTGSPSYASSVLAAAGSGSGAAPSTASLAPSFDLSSLDPDGVFDDIGDSDYLIPALILGGLALAWFALD